MRGALLLVRLAAPADCRPSGGVEPAARVGDRGYSSGRLRRYLRCTGQLRGYRQKAGDTERPPLRGVCGDPAVQLFFGVCGTVRLRAVHPAGGGGVDAGAGGRAGAFGAGNCGVSAGKKYRACAHLCHGGRPCPRAQNADAAVRGSGGSARDLGRRCAGSGGRVRVCAVCGCGKAAVRRYYR